MFMLSLQVSQLYGSEMVQTYSKCQSSLQHTLVMHMHMEIQLYAITKI